ncbi:MAG: hypothetical protein NTZ25_01015 [Candidatus Peregrinibacteria bacterium]|nr:hypothetical protein [Candidatus Peregrinibacteria bacterium]
MKKTLAALFLTGVFLTACGGSSSPAKISVLDDQIYKDAVSSTNIKLCDTIIGASLKDDCQQTIKDEMIKRDAITKSEISLCKTIKNKQLIDSCTIQIQATIDQKNKFNNLLDSRQKLTLKAMNQHDVSICNGIADSNFQQECMMNVIGDPAYASKDKSVCDLFKDKDFKNICLKNPKFN